MSHHCYWIDFVNIFVDESGSFVNAAQSGSWNVVAAYMSLECDRKHLEKILTSLKRAVGLVAKDEVKLKQLNEVQYFQFLRQLGQLNSVVFGAATDAGLNLSADVSKHQGIQAEKIIEHKNKLHHQLARERILSFPRYFVCHQMRFMLPAFADVAYFSSDRGIGLVSNSPVLNADGFDYPPRGLPSGRKRLRCIQRWPPSSHHG